MRNVRMLAIIAAIVLFSFSIWAADTKKASTTSTKKKTSTKSKKTETKSEEKTETKATETTKASGTTLKTDTEKFSYTIGTGFGAKIKENMKQSNIEIDTPSMLKGFQDAFEGNKLALTPEEMNQVRENFKKGYLGKLQAEAKAFMDKNAKEAGVKTTASGLQYKVIKEGTGAIPKDTDKVKANYRGTLTNGKEFDSSAAHGQGPIEFGVGDVIPGWQEALKMMKVGSKWQIFIPPSLAYGEQGTPNIPPDSVLVFELELVDIVKAK